MKYLYILIIFVGNTNCKTKKKVQPSLVGAWNITEIVTVTGEVELAPASTTYTFYNDSTFAFCYAPKGPDTLKYTGTYSVYNLGKAIATHYRFNNIETNDSAYILQLTDSQVILKEQQQNGDTIKFRRIPGGLKNITQ